MKEQLQSTLNIGIMVFRSREAAIKFVDTFYYEMARRPRVSDQCLVSAAPLVLAAPSPFPDLGGLRPFFHRVFLQVDDPAFGTGNAEWDQSRFNRMVREGSSMGDRDKPWILGWNQKARTNIKFHGMYKTSLPPVSAPTLPARIAVHLPNPSWARR